MRNRSIVLAFFLAALFNRNSEAFVSHNNNNKHECFRSKTSERNTPSNNDNNIALSTPLTLMTTATTALCLHRFNGGYDPSSPLTWTPQQAAEFTVHHHGEPKYIGLQLRMAIQHWSGANLAEFLTRLYLGQVVVETPRKSTSSSSSASSWTSIGQESRQQQSEPKTKIVYEPQNVRTPQWKGLETREGVTALYDLLREALSPTTLDSQEMARFAEAFLLKEYKWPRPLVISSSDDPTKKKKNQTARGTVAISDIVFEKDTFYTCGHARILARILWEIRKEKATSLEWDDVAGMLTLAEHEHKETAPLQLAEFYHALVSNIGLSTKEKTLLVGRLALGGWNPSEIPKFVSKVLPSKQESLQKNTTLSSDGPFADIPLAAERLNLNSSTQSIDEDEDQDDLDNDYASDVDSIEEQVRLVSTLKRATLSVRSEYDQLVQSYWKQVDISSTSSAKKSTQNSKEQKFSTETTTSKECLEKSKR